VGKERREGIRNWYRISELCLKNPAPHSSIDNDVTPALRTHHPITALTRPLRAFINHRYDIVSFFLVRTVHLSCHDLPFLWRFQFVRCRSNIMLEILTSHGLSREYNFILKTIIRREVAVNAINCLENAVC